MTKKETAFPCSPANSISPLKLISYAAIAIFSLLLIAPAALAQSKQRHARTKTEERPRRVENKKQPKVSRETSRRVSLISKPVKVSSSKPTPQPPAVRKTVIVSEKQANNRPARAALVNDIVIISEAAPVASRLPATAPSITAANNMPSIWPVAGSMRGGFGFRRNPFGGSGSEFHKGQDISAPMGTPVIATADGVITIAGWQRGYGRVVYIDHGNGLTTRYGHLSRIDVMEGQTIKRGEQLGLVGSTGRSTGPHLHYEVRLNGQPLNPMSYLPQAPLIAPISGLE